MGGKGWPLLLTDHSLNYIVAACKDETGLLSNSIYIKKNSNLLFACIKKMLYSSVCCKTKAQICFCVAYLKYRISPYPLARYHFFLQQSSELLCLTEFVL